MVSGMDRRKGREAAQRANTVAAHDIIEPRLIAGKAGAVIVAMPEVKHAGRETSVLAPHAGMDETDREVGVLEPPAIEARVEPVHALEVAPRDRQVAGARALPARRRGLAQRTER